MKKLFIYALSCISFHTCIAKAESQPTPVGIQIVAKINTVIGAPMAGTLVEFPLVDGNRFKEGDIIAKFQCAQQEAALAHARAQYAKYNGILFTQQQLKNLGTYSQVDYKTASAELQAAVAEIGMATANQQNCTIKAPFSGRVSNISAHNHQFMQAGAPMLDILADKELEVEAIVPSVWLTWLKTDSKFKVTVQETSKTYNAHIVRLSGRVDPGSRTIKVYGVIDGDGPELLPGMSGDAVFENYVNK